MIDILSHIVEFRNGESGLHIQHIHAAVELLLRQLVTQTDKYPLTEYDISLISTASALHDIGKINIPDSILNKPGKLTREEFEVMKTHTTIGASILKSFAFHQDEPLIRVAYDICRWHHERYDGGGYPDGLCGDEIPITAQVVALADVYDALTSERCYKKAYSQEEAIRTILNGECGRFNPLLLDCLLAVKDQLYVKLHTTPTADAAVQVQSSYPTAFFTRKSFPIRVPCSISSPVSASSVIFTQSRRTAWFLTTTPQTARFPSAIIPPCRPTKTRLRILTP